MEYTDIIILFTDFWFQYFTFWLLVFGSSIPIMFVFNMILKSIRSLISQGNHI